MSRGFESCIEGSRSYIVEKAVMRKGEKGGKGKKKKKMKREKGEEKER